MKTFAPNLSNSKVRSTPDAAQHLSEPGITWLRYFHQTIVMLMGRLGRRLLVIPLLMFASVGHAAEAAPEEKAPHFEHFLVGDINDVRRPSPALPSLVLMGGGRSVPDAFRWMMDKSGGGNFVVIRAAGSDAYNDYLYSLGQVSSVETLVIPSREAANDPFVVRRVRQAEALLIAGGNQGDYVRSWKDTGLERAIHELARNNVPIAGFSAGLAILGEYAFTAERGPIRSAAAMANPFDEAITLIDDFLTMMHLDNIITDSHFDSRDRIGRLVTFMSRIIGKGQTKVVRGIGVGVGTALLVENGLARRIGSGAAYFLEARHPAEVLHPHMPLTHRDIRVQRLDSTTPFDLRRWAGKGDDIEHYSVSVVNGVLASSREDNATY